MRHWINYPHHENPKQEKRYILKLRKRLKLPKQHDDDLCWKNQRKRQFWRRKWK